MGDVPKERPLAIDATAQSASRTNQRSSHGENLDP
jgi:hypothetical protein